MKNHVGMVVYYSPTGKRVRGKKVWFFDRWKLERERRRSYELPEERGWKNALMATKNRLL